MDEDQPEELFVEDILAREMHDHLRKRYSRRNRCLKGRCRYRSVRRGGTGFRAPGLSYAAGKQVRGAASHPESRRRPRSPSL